MSDHPDAGKLLELRVCELARLCAEAPDDLLLMSRDDCHALKVSSIVVGRTEAGGLRRIFLAWPGHRLAENHLLGELPVGIHDHRYSLRLKLLTGKVRNTTYRRGPGRVLHEFEFRSGQMQGPPKTFRVGFAEIELASQAWLSPDEWLPMEAAAVHNVDCEGPAAWLVEEGLVEQDVTRLFTPQARIETGDLYQPFESAEAVRDHVARFIEAIPAPLPDAPTPNLGESRNKLGGAPAPDAPGNHYARRDIEDLCEYYTRHLAAMTAESLHSKSEIAAELAWRDRKADAERAENQLLREKLLADDSDSIVAACNCMTKSPEIQYHKRGCKYRLIVERDEWKRRAEAEFNIGSGYYTKWQKAERDLEALRGVAGELAAALQYFANFACNDGIACDCNNCTARKVIAKWEALAALANLQGGQPLVGGSD